MGGGWARPALGGRRRGGRARLPHPLPVSYWTSERVAAAPRPPRVMEGRRHVAPRARGAAVCGAKAGRAASVPQCSRLWRRRGVCRLPQLSEIFCLRTLFIASVSLCTSKSASSVDPSGALRLYRARPLHPPGRAAAGGSALLPAAPGPGPCGWVRATLQAAAPPYSRAEVERKPRALTA